MPESPDVAFNAAVAAIASAGTAGTLDVENSSTFNDLRKATLHLGEMQSKVLEVVDESTAKLVMLFLIQFVHKNRMQVRRVAEVIQILVVSPRWREAWAADEVQGTLTADLRDADSKVLQTAAQGSPLVLHGGSASALPPSEASTSLGPEEEDEGETHQLEPSAKINWRGQWIASTGHTWDLCQDGRAQVNSTFAGDEFRVFEKFEGNSQVIWRQDGWKVDMSKSDSEVLIWTHPGQADVRWARPHPELVPQRHLYAPGWPAGNVVPSEVICQAGHMPGAQEEALQVAEKAVAENPEHVLCQVEFLVLKGWIVKKYVDALRLTRGKGRRHLVFAPAYIHAPPFEEAIEQSA